MRAYPHSLTAILLLILLSACTPGPGAARPEVTAAPSPSLQPPTSAPTPIPTLPPATSPTGAPTPVATVAGSQALTQCEALTVADVQSVAPWVESLPDRSSETTINGSQIDTCRFFPGIEVRTTEVAEADGDPRQWLTSEMSSPNQEIAGLGEAAYWSENALKLGVLRGRMVLTVVVVDVGEGYDRLATARALAEMLLPRLGQNLVQASLTPVAEELPSCDALTPDEAGRILGALTGAPEPFDFTAEGRPPSRACLYRGKANQAMVDWTRYEQEDDARSLLRDRAGSQPVADLGDEAAWDPASLKLLVRRGAVLVEVSIALPDGAYERALLIGQIALARIP